MYGPPGAGKKTRIQCILRELFGLSVEKLRIENQTYVTPSNTKVDIRTVSSNFHIEVNPSDVGVQDRVIVQELIKSAASSGALSDRNRFKVVVITEADKLTRDAQHALRRTMEKYMTHCRIILAGNSASRIIPAIKSRCLLVRIAAPSNEKTIEILANIAKKENFPADNFLLKEIASASNRNLRRAILMLETCKLSGLKKPVLPQWQTFIQKMAKKIMDQQSVRKLEEVRSDLYELQAHLIPPEVVFEVMVDHILSTCDSKVKSTLLRLAAFYEHKMRLGSKQIYHFEAFVANFMNVLKSFKDTGKICDLEIY